MIQIRRPDSVYSSGAYNFDDICGDGTGFGWEEPCFQGLEKKYGHGFGDSAGGGDGWGHYLLGAIGQGITRGRGDHVDESTPLATLLIIHQNS